MIDTEDMSVKLESICRPRQWKTIAKTQLLDEGYPVFGANGIIGFYSEFNHEAPTILITCRGASCGTLNVCTPKSYVTGNAMALDELDTERVELRYLLHFLRYRGLNDVVTGTAQPQITRQTLSKVRVTLPQIAEQRRIAAILDKADTIRHQRQEGIRLNEELLRSTFLEMFGDPVTNPKGWKQQKLGTLATFTGGGTPARKKPSYFDGDICWATSKDMKGEFLTDTQEHITTQAIEESATKLVPAGTILVVVKSKILMHRLPVLHSMVPTCFGQDLKGITCSIDLSSVYLARHLRIGQLSLLSKARGANTEGLTLEHLRNFKVMRPPTELMNKYAELEEAVQASLVKARLFASYSDDLFNSLVQRAFRGEL